MFESSSYGLTTLHRHFTAVFSREFLSVFAKLKKKKKRCCLHYQLLFSLLQGYQKGYLQSNLMSAKKLEAKVFSTYETKLKNCCIELIFILEKFKVMYRSGFFVFMFKSLELLVIT